MNNFSRFKGQKAIVTGGSSGIGLAIARRLRAEGASVAVFDFDAKAFAALSVEFGAAHRFLSVDVTDEAQMNAAVTALVGLLKLTLRTLLVSPVATLTLLAICSPASSKEPLLLKSIHALRKAALPVVLVTVTGSVTG